MGAAAPLPLAKVLGLAEHLVVSSTPDKTNTGTEKYSVPVPGSRPQQPIMIAGVCHYQNQATGQIFPVETVSDKLMTAAALLDTIAARESQYGEFQTQAATAQLIKTSFTGLAKLEPDMAEALELIATKISRILNGNPNKLDHWHDIAGYATLIEQRLLKDAAQKKS